MDDINPLDKLATIHLPPAPDWPAFFSGLSLLVVALMFLMWIAYLLYYRIYLRTKLYLPRRLSTLETAQLKLHLIRQQIEQNIDSEIDSETEQRAMAYRLSNILRLGLGLEQLEHQCPGFLDHVNGEKEHWHNTLSILDKLRYRMHDDTLLTISTIDHIEHWLNMKHTATKN